jgi:hypothetical protein
VQLIVLLALFTKIAVEHPRAFDDELSAENSAIIVVDELQPDGTTRR